MTYYVPSSGQREWEKTTQPQVQLQRLCYKFIQQAFQAPTLHHALGHGVKRLSLGTHKALGPSRGLICLPLGSLDVVDAPMSGLWSPQCPFCSPVYFPAHPGIPGSRLWTEERVLDPEWGNHGLGDLLLYELGPLPALDCGSTCERQMLTQVTPTATSSC